MNDVTSMKGRSRPSPLNVRNAALFTTATAGPDTPSPPSLQERSKSVPNSPAFGCPLISPRTRRMSQRRIKSHEIKIPRSYDLGIRLTKATPDSPRQIEIKVVWDRRIHFYRFDLRKLLFWMVLLVFMTGFTSAYKIGPASRLLRPMQLPKLAATLPEASAGAQGPTHPLVETIFDELQNIAVDNIAEVAAPDFGVAANVAQELSRFVMAGEISFDKLLNAAGRACISSVMHKVVGAVVASDIASDVVSCVLHIPAVVIV